MKKLSRNTERTLAFCAALAYLAAFLVLLMHVHSSDAPISTGVLLLANFIGALLVATKVFLWSRLDEAAREAHKVSWYWGAPTAFILFVFLLLSGVAQPVIDQTLDHQVFDDPMLKGAFAGYLVQLIGYAIIWSGWWLIRR